MSDAVAQELLSMDTEEMVAIRAPWNLLEVYPSTCGTKASAFKFEGRVLLEPHRDSSPGHRKNCPFCARGDANRHAKQMFHRLMGFEWSDIWGIVLTTPKSFVDPSRYNEEWYPEKRMKDLSKLVQKYMKLAHPNVGYSVCIHHWASSDPLGGPHFHAHITAMCATFQFVEGGGLYDHQLEPRLTKAGLLAKKQLWQKILKMSVLPDLRYQYFTRKTQVWSDDEGEHHEGGVGRLMHWLKYCYRYYIQDVEKFLLKDENAGMPLDLTQVKWLHFHNRKWQARISAYGCLSNRKRKYFIHDEIVNKRIEEQRELESKRYDPVSKNPVEQKYKQKELVDCPAFLKKSEMIVHQRVRYVDYPHLLEDFVYYLDVPKSCMRWSEYHSFKRKKEIDESGE